MYILCISGNIWGPSVTYFIQHFLLVNIKEELFLPVLWLYSASFHSSSCEILPVSPFGSVCLFAPRVFYFFFLSLPSRGGYRLRSQPSACGRHVQPEGQQGPGNSHLHMAFHLKENFSSVPLIKHKLKIQVSYKIVKKTPYIYRG